MTASVAGYGDFTLSDTFLYFSNNSDGINGFYDIAIGQDLMGWAGFSPYNSVSSAGPVSVGYDYGGNVNTVLGKADVLHGDNLVFSALVSGAPEPSVWAMLVIGLLGTGLAIRSIGTKSRRNAGKPLAINRTRGARSWRQTRRFSTPVSTELSSRLS